MSTKSISNDYDAVKRRYFQALNIHTKTSSPSSSTASPSSPIPSSSAVRKYPRVTSSPPRFNSPSTSTSSTTSSTTTTTSSVSVSLPSHSALTNGLTRVTSSSNSNSNTSTVGAPHSKEKRFVDSEREVLVFGTPELQYTTTTTTTSTSTTTSSSFLTASLIGAPTTPVTPSRPVPLAHNDSYDDLSTAYSFPIPIQRGDLIREEDDDSYGTFVPPHLLVDSSSSFSVREYRRKKNALTQL